LTPPDCSAQGIVTELAMSIAPTGIKEVREQGFVATSARRGDTIIVTMSGNADSGVQEQLKAFLEELHNAAKFLAIKEAVFDMHDLYFINSACLSLFLRLLNAVHESRETHAYTFRFRSNPNLHWQKRRLEALRSYAKELVIVE
jgi:anti-anti-sigma factor